MKKFIALLTAAAFMFGAVGCFSSGKGKSRRSSRDRDEQVEEEETEDNDGILEVEAEFGTFVIDNGWVEASGSSSSGYTFCNEVDVNSSQAPNNLMVKNDTNYYSAEEHEDFCAAILQQIHGQAASYNGTACMTEYGTFGENMCYRFDMDCEDFDVIQWYVIGDHEYVMFSLMIVDEDRAEDDNCMQMAEDAVNSFVWNR